MNKEKTPPNHEVLTSREDCPEKLSYDTPQLNRVGSVIKWTQGSESGFADGMGTGSGPLGPQK